MLELERTLLDAISSHAVQSYPHECCGVLLGTREESRRMVSHAVRCRNVDARPTSRYTIDPSDLIGIQKAARARGLEIIGFYHSHPDHPATASASDLAEADWSDCSYLILSVEGLRVTAMRSYFVQNLESERVFTEEPLISAAIPA